MTRKKRMQLWLLLLGLLLLLGAGWAGWDYLEYRSALDTTREWAQLAPFPASTKNLKVDTRGGMFTREFRVEFDAPPADVEAWLAASPGIPGAVMTRTGKSRHYQITPGGGAAFAELTFDEGTGHVRVRVYWS